MKRFLLILKKTLLIFFLLLIYTVVFTLLYENFIRNFLFPPADYAENVTDPTEKTAVPTPLPIPSNEPSPTVSQPEVNVNQPQENIPSESADALMIPVVGIKREQLQDTFTAARSEGRVHNAIDIMAPGGTPVIAVADGQIVKFFESERGGITVYQFSSDHRFIYYYAHLQKRADNIKEKDLIKRGTLVGYVGDTGNAGAGNYHLHFEIMIPENPNDYWKGTDINPYPLLKNGIESH